MKVCGELMEHGEVVLHPKVVDEGDELARRFCHSGVRARSFGRTCRFRSDQESSCHAFPANENVRARDPLFLVPTLPRDTSGKSREDGIWDPRL